MMDIEALIDSGVAAEAEKVEVPEPIIEEAPQPAVEEQPAPEPTPEPEPVVEAKEDVRTVPLATYLENRDELKELRRWKAEQDAKASQAAPAEMPDPYDDPHGFASWQNGQVQQAMTAQRFNMSDLMAKQVHGAEVVEAAGAWAAERAKTDPGFVQSYMTNEHPIDWIVRQHKQADLMKQIGENPDDYVRRRAAEMGLLATPTPAPVPVAAQPAPQTPEPPRSLVAVPAKGGAVKDIPVGPLAGVEAIFPR